MLSGEARNTNCIVFGLTQSGLDPMIYYNRGKYANHFTRMRWPLCPPRCAHTIIHGVLFIFFQIFCECTLDENSYLTFFVYLSYVSVCNYRFWILCAETRSQLIIAYVKKHLNLLEIMCQEKKTKQTSCAPFISDKIRFKLKSRSTLDQHMKTQRSKTLPMDLA